MVADRLRAFERNVSQDGVVIEEMVVTGRRIAMRYPEGIQVQTGPGLPEWQWNTEALRWFGPVSATQEMSLALLPPVVVRLLNAVMAVLVLAVTIGLAYAQYSKATTWRPPGWLTSVVPSLLIVLIGVLLPTDPARAQVIDSEILEDLERRLLEPPSCLPTCASIEYIALDMDADELIVTLRIHTGAFLTVPLPGRFDGPAA